MSKIKDMKAEYRSTLKSLDTEEHIDLFFYRPLGYLVAKLSSKIGVTPNVITIISIFLGVGAGVAFYYTNIWINILGILLLIAANMLDSADGQLARMTKNYSRLGRILDGMAGDLWFITIYVAICLREVCTSAFFIENPWAIWVLAVTAGMSHIKQAQMADYYRQIHLKFLSGKTISELEDLDALQEKQKGLTWGKDFGKLLMLKIYTNYTKQQQLSTKNMTRLTALLHKRYPDGNFPEALRKDFRELSLPLMKYTNFLSFNWRSITLFASILVAMPWIYFVVELTVFNAALIYMCNRHEKICKIIINRIEEGRYDSI